MELAQLYTAAVKTFLNLNAVFKCDTLGHDGFLRE